MAVRDFLNRCERDTRARGQVRPCARPARSDLLEYEIKRLGFHTPNLSELGDVCQPISETFDLVPDERLVRDSGYPPEMDTLEHRQLLARNVRALMDASPDLCKTLRLARAAQVGQATVDRILSASAGVSVDSVAAVARALGVSPWVLLHPDPKIGRVEAEFYAKMRAPLRHK